MSAILTTFVGATGRKISVQLVDVGDQSPIDVSSEDLEVYFWARRGGQMLIIEREGTKAKLDPEDVEEVEGSLGVVDFELEASELLEPGDCEATIEVVDTGGEVPAPDFTLGLKLRILDTIKPRSAAADVDSVVNDGSGYEEDDLLTVAGGAASAPAVLRVLTVDASGEVLTAAIEDGGTYVSRPANPVAVTGGEGSAATFNISWNYL